MLRIDPEISVVLLASRLILLKMPSADMPSVMTRLGKKYVATFAKRGLTAPLTLWVICGSTLWRNHSSVLWPLANSQAHVLPPWQHTRKYIIPQQKSQKFGLAIFVQKRFIPHKFLATTSASTLRRPRSAVGFVQKGFKLVITWNLIYHPTPRKNRSNVENVGVVLYKVVT